MYPICNLRYFQVARVFKFYSLLSLKDCSTLNISNSFLKMVSRSEGRICFCFLLPFFPFSGLSSSAPGPLGAVSPVGIRGCSQHLFSGCRRGRAMFSDYRSITRALNGAAHHLIVCESHVACSSRSKNRGGLLCPVSQLHVQLLWLCLLHN